MYIDTWTDTYFIYVDSYDIFEEDYQIKSKYKSNNKYNSKGTNKGNPIVKHCKFDNFGDKKKQRNRKKFVSDKISKERRSSDKHNKFYDKHQLIIKQKEQKIEKLIEQISVNAYKNLYGEHDNFITENDANNNFDFSFNYDSDDYSYNTDNYDDYDNNYINFESAMDYTEYFKKQAEINTKATEFYNVGNFVGLYSLFDIVSSTEKVLDDRQCTICWTNCPNIKLKCGHEYCNECFSYNYFVMNRPRFCCVCRSNMCEHSFNTIYLTHLI